MRALLFLGVGKLAFREVPEPQLAGSDEALVRPLAAARCDLDPVWMTRPLGRSLRFGLASHLVDGAAARIFGAPPFAPPFAVGHECVAEVVEKGPGVQTLSLGQRVVVPFQVSCGACGCCARGLTSCCTSVPTFTATYGFGPGAQHFGGCVSELVRVPYADAMLVPLPEGVEPSAAASVSDNVSDGYRSVSAALRARPGATVLVVGGAAKSVGLYAAASARALGASQVDYYDTDRTRLEIAERLGVRACPLSRRRFGAFQALPQRYAISVDACSDSAGRGLELALRSLEPGGVCSALGIYPRTRTPIPLMDMYTRGTTLSTGITNARSHIPEVLALIAQRKLDPTLVTTLTADWEDADRAFLEDTTKVVVCRRPG
jgi:threonine dehydrogenase-like Zn-dependent dehydrogenase